MSCAPCALIGRNEIGELTEPKVGPETGMSCLCAACLPAYSAGFQPVPSCAVCRTSGKHAHRYSSNMPASFSAVIALAVVPLGKSIAIVSMITGDPNVKMVLKELRKPA